MNHDELKSNNRPLPRREWLRRLGLGAAGVSLGAIAEPAIAANPTTLPSPRKRSLRIAHLTDVHVQPERDADKGLEQCLHHVQSQADKPDLIVLTGDCVYDSFGQTRERTAMLWDLWSRIMKSECSLPVVALLGNHDIWGWNKKKSKTTGEEPNYRKRWACEMLGLDKPYHSVDRGGWHVVMLDSVQPWADRQYTAHLDEAQKDWLASDLAANAGKPTLVCSHVPILSITPIMAEPPEEGVGKNGEPNTILGHAGMHSDWRDLKATFK